MVFICLHSSWASTHCISLTYWNIKMHNYMNCTRGSYLNKLINQMELFKSFSYYRVANATHSTDREEWTRGHICKYSLIHTCKLPWFLFLTHFPVRCPNVVLCPVFMATRWETWVQSPALLQVLYLILGRSPSPLRPSGKNRVADIFLQFFLLFCSILDKGQVLKGILIAKAVTSVPGNPISDFALPLRMTANIPYLEVPTDPHQIWPYTLE